MYLMLSFIGLGGFFFLLAMGKIVAAAVVLVGAIGLLARSRKGWKSNPQDTHRGDR
jgi:hypothetical protein